MEDAPHVWEVPEASGAEFYGLMLGFQLELMMLLPGEGAGAVNIGWPGVARLTDAGAAHALDAEGPWTELEPLFALRGRRLERLQVDDQGNLRAGFAGGAVLELSPEPRRYGWHLGGPDGLFLLCPPGGGDPREAAAEAARQLAEEDQTEAPAGRREGPVDDGP